MSTTVIYRDFKPLDNWRNKFRRAEYEIWDANLAHGDIRPFACPEQICSSGPVDTIYPLTDCECHGFEGHVSAFKGFCDTEHFYLSSGKLMVATETQLCNDNQGFRSGAPVGFIAPSASSSCSSNQCDAVGVSYVVTYVTASAGVITESAPSPASNLVASGGNVPGVSVTAPAHPSNEFNIVETRVYRAESTYEDGASQMDLMGTEWFLVRSFAGNTGASFTDNVSTANLGHVLTTHMPSAFPAPENLISADRTLDGIVVADTNRVYISIAGQAQFTFDGVVDIEDEIVWIAAIQNTVFVFTKGYHVKLGYRHTDSTMTVDKQVIKRRIPVKSIGSISCYDTRVFFASEYSLYSWDIGGYGSDINSELPKQLMSTEQWKNLDPSTVVGTAYEFGYILSSEKINYSLMITFDGDGTDTTLPTSMMPISYIDADAFGLDDCGHILYRSGDDLYRWDWRVDDCGEFLPHEHVIPPLKKRNCCPWKAKFYIDNEGKNRFTKMRVEWDTRTADSLSLNYYHSRCGSENIVNDSVLKVISCRGFSIPKFTSSRAFIVELSGCGILHEVRLATSMQELVSNSNQFIGSADER